MGYGPLALCAPAKRREERTEEGAEDFAGERCVVGAAVAERVGQRENPLADGHFRKNAIDEVCGGVGHAPAFAGRTETTPLARERDEAIVAAGVAVKPQEAVSQDSAPEVRAQLLLDESGRRAIAFACARQEGLELLTDDRVERGLLGSVPLVRWCGARDEEARVRGGAGCDLGSHARGALRAVYRGVGALSGAERRGPARFENRSSPRARWRWFTPIGETGERWCLAGPEQLTTSKYDYSTRSMDSSQRIVLAAGLSVTPGCTAMARSLSPSSRRAALFAQFSGRRAARRPRQEPPQMATWPRFECFASGSQSEPSPVRASPHP